MPAPIERSIDQAVDVRDVRVAERRQRLRLSREAREPIGIERKGLGQDLDCDVAMERQVARPVHLAHATSADQGVDDVRTYPSAGAK